MTRALGIDLSRWDGVVNYSKAIAAGASFVYIKASQKVVDPMFANNWKDAKAAGILHGAYHYLDWTVSLNDQTMLFTNLLRGDPGELPPVLDLEMEPPKGYTAAMVSGYAWNFLTAVEKATGRVPVLYTGYYYWNQWGSNNISWTYFPFWLAWYAPEWWVHVPKPWTKWTFWQYTDRAKGSTFGCQSAGVDCNYFNGTVDELLKFCYPVLPPVVPPVKNTYRVNAGVNPNVHYPDASSPVIDTILAGTLIVVDDMTSQQWYAHFKPQVSFPLGGWVYKPYITKA